MEVRLAVAADIDQITALFAEQFEVQASINPYIIQRGAPSRQFIENIITNENSDIFVAEADNKIIGFASVSERKTMDFDFVVPHRYARLMELIVTKEHQRKGIATKLTNTVKKWCSDRGLDHIELSVYVNNDGAIDFYIQNGYVENEKVMICKL